MTDELNNFLIFLLENSEDDRISISKKIKYGYNHFYVRLNVDQKDKSYYIKYIEILIDNRNNCVVVESEKFSVTIEDDDFVKRWSDILDKLLTDKIKNKVSEMIENSLSSCFDPSLHREYQMKKIFKKDESIQPRRNRKNK